MEFLHAVCGPSINPAWAGTGTLDDYLAIVGPLANANPAGLGRQDPIGPLAAPPRKGQPPRPGMIGSDTGPTAPKATAKQPIPQHEKPPFPEPVAQVRAKNRKGKDSPHPSHAIAEKSEEDHARRVHEYPNEVVLMWGKEIGANGVDTISYNLETKRITLWDDKFRSEARRITPSKTFDKGSPRLANALREAIDAIHESTLSAADKEAALESIEKRTFQTRTHGSGNVKNSTLR